MALLAINGLTIAFRGPPLLDDVSCQIQRGERVGLLGRNGQGKSTLLKIVAGQLPPDHGTCDWAPGAVVCELPQDVPSGLAGPVADVVRGGLAARPADESDAWIGEQRLERVLADLQLEGERDFQTLSAGMKRRVLLGRSLVAEPDVLLLDEPTNHLDIDAITQLEDFLSRWPGTLLFVTHDRAFLRRLATRILEIDRGRLFDWACDYDQFLKRKEQALAAEEKQQALFDKRLAEEEAWIRQGIKARRTRNEGRVRRLEHMRRERSERRESTGQVRLRIQEAARSGRLVAEVKDATFGYGDRPIVEAFSTTIMRGDKIGLIGPNGVGKTTLLKIVLGQLPPQQGSVRLGANLQIAYFDQLRGQLDPEATVQDNVGDGYETVNLQGRPRHVLGYLQDFLFTPDRAQTPVKFLSGGERNRVLLAKLFAKPANVIVLDEPTNDLDSETLELLEERLGEFEGTVLVVSHDRAFLNNVVGSCIVFEPEGVREYVGGYDDWQRQRKSAVALGGTPRSAAAASAASSVRGSQAALAAVPAALAAPAKKKLSYKDQRELESLPATIERLEAELATQHAKLADPDFYRGAPERIAAEAATTEQLQHAVARAYARWEELLG